LTTTTTTTTTQLRPQFNMEVDTGYSRRCRQVAVNCQSHAIWRWWWLTTDLFKQQQFSSS